MCCCCLALRNLIAYAITIQPLIRAVIGQGCTAPYSVGSAFQTEAETIEPSHTYILTGYTVQCEGIVTTWEFCYRLLTVPSLTFNPGIWEKTGSSGGDPIYSLIQSNTVTFNPSVGSTFSCQNYTLPVTEQFTAPSGSVVGLYADLNVLLLRITGISQITYQVTGNQSSVVGGSTNDVKYNIAIRVHLDINTDNTSSSIMSVSPTVMATTSSPVMAAATTPVMATTTTPVMATTTTPVMATTTTPVMSTTTTPVMATTTTPVMATTTTPVMSTTTTLLMATTTTVMATTSVLTLSTPAGSDGDSSSSTGAIGIIAGCVIGVIIFVVIFLLIIILLWYRKQKKGKLTIPPDTYQLDNHRRDCEAITENANQHSIINNQYSVINHVDNGSVLYKNIQPDYDIPSDSDYSKADKPAESSFYYSNPLDTLTRDRPKLASNDYDSLQNPDAFSSAQRTYSNTLHEYSTVPDTTLSYSTTYEVSASMNTGDEEAIYSDPGHSEEAIYAYFESKRFRSISENTVRTLQKLGSGEFGVVHLGTWTDGSADPIQVAVKTLNSKCSESDRVKFLREAAIMGQFKNNHIVELYGVVTEKESTMIILEYMPKGDLHEFLIDLRNTTPPEFYGDLKHDLLSFCRQISSGFSYLASKLFVHRDLAARNILVSSDDVCKIADFGMARDVSDDTYYMSTGGKIPVVWTAPEAIFYKKYSTQSDVWSIGCVMYEIWSLGHKPFEDYSGREYVDKITTGYRLPPPPGCPRSIYKLMIQCWNPVPNKRIDPSELSRTLQKSDRTLLPSSIAPNDSEELSTKLGASLETNSQLYTDLQNAYIPK